MSGPGLDPQGQAQPEPSPLAAFMGSRDGAWVGSRVAGAEPRVPEDSACHVVITSTPCSFPGCVTGPAEPWAEGQGYSSAGFWKTQAHLPGKINEKERPKRDSDSRLPRDASP